MRITAAIREAILGNALERAGITARQKKAVEDRAALAEAIRVYVIGDVTLEHLETSRRHALKLCSNKAMNVPSIYINSSIYFKVNFPGDYESLYLDGSTDVLKLGREQTHLTDAVKKAKKPTPYNTVQLTQSVPEEAALIKEYERIKLDDHEIRRIKNDITSSVYAITKANQSDKSLFKAWPEAKELWPETEEQIKKYRKVNNVPVVVATDKLNALIGLPTPENVVPLK